MKQANRQQVAKWITSLGLVILMLALPAASFAQLESSVFQKPERTLLQHLSRAKRAMAEERFSDAVIELGALLNSPYLEAQAEASGDSQDYFVDADGETGARRSIKGEAQRLLGSMPRQGRELYELQFGSDAQALLDRAVRDQNMDDLNEVIRRYFHTKAGYEAMVLLGRLQLDRGRPLAAALCFKRVLESPAAAPKYDPHLSVLLGACWVYSNMPEQATSTMERLKQRFPKAEIELTEGKRELLPDSEDAVVWLTKYFGPALKRGQIDASQWLVHRGNLQRNATCAGGIPLTQMRWQTPITSDPADRRLVSELQQSFMQQGFPAIPSVSPLAVDDVVLMRTPERLLAINFKTGKQIWEYPWWNSSFQSGSQASRTGSRTVELATRKMQLRQRLWHDSAYGLISSDGSSVYLVDDLRFTSLTQSQPQFLAGRAFRQTNPNYPQSYNQLAALDVKREGSLRWKVGGASGEDEPKLAGAFFMGPPLPLLGQLYAIAEVKKELRLVVLDAETGKQEWTQQIAHVADGPSIVRNRERRLAGATPSFGNGVLICPTSAGAIVAVDVTTRSLLWGYAYRQNSNQVTSNGFGGVNPYGGAVEAPGEGWADATATIAEGSVLMTPIDSDVIVCLDLLTGVPNWQPKERKGDLADMQFVACVHQGKAILVGKNQVIAIGLKDGETVWKAPLEGNGEMPSGRGFQTGDSYFFPTTASQLIEINLPDGKIVQRVKSPGVLGNLLCYDDQMISQGVDQVAAFYQIKPLRQMVDDRLAKSADDPWALARQGELLVHDGDPKQALEVLQRAQELAPRDEAVRTLLVSSFLELLRKDFDSHVGIAAAIDPQIQLPHLRLEFLRLMAAGMEAKGDVVGAAEKYLQLANMQIQNFNPYGNTEPPSVIADSRRTIRLDRWVQARLSRVYGEATAEQRAKMDEAVRHQHTTEVELRQFIKYFGFHPLANEARLQLVPLLAVSDRALEADLMLARLESDVSRERTGPVLAEIAALLMEVDETDLAAQYYRRLASGWADVDCGDGRTGQSLYAAAAQQNALRGKLAPLSRWPVGQTKWHELRDRRNRQATQSDMFVPLMEQQRPAGEQFSIVYDGGVSSVVLRDGRGQELLRLPLADGNSYHDHPLGTNYAKIYGQLLLIVLGDETVALDLSRGPQNSAAILWRAGLSAAGQDIVPTRPQAREWKNTNPLDPATPSSYSMVDSTGKQVGSAGPVSESGVTYLRSTTLICADPITGEPVWKLAEMEPGCTLFGDAEYTFAAPRQSTTAQVIDSRTGQILGQRSVPDWQHRWTTYGRFVLAWETMANSEPAAAKSQESASADADQTPAAEDANKNKNVRLFLYDTWREADVWSETLTAGARGTLVEGDQVAVLESDGRFMIRSLRGPEVLLQQQVEAESDLDAIYVLPSSERILLVTDTDQPPSVTAKQRIQELEGALPAPLIFGHVHAFNRETGEALWQTPATIENYSLPLVQPTEVPTLWFMRRQSSSSLAPAPSERISVLCLDRRDGRKLLEEDDVAAAKSTTYNVRVNYDNAAVTLAVGGNGFVVEFTDEPAVPEPPAQTGSAASSIDDVTGLWNVAGAVVDAILPGDKN